MSSFSSIRESGGSLPPLPSSNQAEVRSKTPIVEMSAADLREVLRLLPESYLRLTRDGGIIEVWEGIQGSLNFQEDLQGRHLESVLPAETWRQFESALRKVAAGSHVLSFGYQLRAEDRVCFFDTRMSALPNGDVVAVIRDITEQKTSEEALRASQELFALATRATHDLVWDLDLITGKTTRGMNFWQQFGYDRAGDWELLLHPEDSEKVHSSFKHSVDQGSTSWQAEYRFQRADGSYAFVLDRAYIVYDESGRPLRAIGAISDISERKQAEKVLMQLAAIVGSSDDAIVGTTLDGIVTSWNASAVNLYGYTSDEIVGRNVDLLALPGRQEEIHAVLEKIRRGEPVHHLEVQRRRKDGSVVDVSLTVSPIRSDRGEILGVSSIARDITERKQSEKQLHLQAEVIAAAANAIVITDREANIVWVNPAFTTLTGYTLQEVIGRNPRILNSGTQSRECYQRLWETILSGKTWRGEIENRRKDGSLYTEEMTITPVSHSGEIVNFIAIKQDVSERKRAEEELRAAEEKYREMFENSIIGMFQTRPDGSYITANDAIAKMYRAESAAAHMQKVKDIGKQLYVDPERRKQFQRLMEKDGSVRDFEFQVYRHDGTKMWLLENARAVRSQTGEILYYEGTATDITEKKILEEQLRQAQKMEAIGRLAGGVAHDFNNILGVINGYSELLKLRGNLEPAVVHQIDEIHAAGQRAASLTQQLLAFSRKQITQPRVFGVNELISNLSKMLRRLLGDDVELLMQLSSSNTRIKADPGQIEQVIMNLAVNARDAMPEGGKLIIETDCCQLDESYVIRHRPVRPGKYVRIIVRDSGCGMDSETMSHLFEPFFTTKELGRGTGLGLSIVYGIVKQADGYVWVYSEPGQGTIFKIYFPLQEVAVQCDAAPPRIQSLQGHETVLVAEDDRGLRALIVGFLRELGYVVLEASSGAEAMDIVSRQNGPIQALITDIMMPGMSGCELTALLSTLHPGIATLYVSGYMEHGADHKRVLRPNDVFLQKPFALSELSRRLREVLAN